MTAPSATGRCLCGAIRFEVDGDPLSTNFCHCESCRRHGGGPAAAFVTFRKDAVRWSGAERARYRSSPPVVRTFCGRCGSPLAYEHDDSADEVDLYLGAFDDPGRFPPGKHVHYHRTRRINRAADRLGAGSADCPSRFRIRERSRRSAIRACRPSLVVVGAQHRLAARQSRHGYGRAG